LNIAKTFNGSTGVFALCPRVNNGKENRTLYFGLKLRFMRCTSHGRLYRLYLILIENRNQNVTSLDQHRRVSAKMTRMGFEPIHAPTRDVHWVCWTEDGSIWFWCNLFSWPTNWSEKPL